MQNNKQIDHVGTISDIKGEKIKVKILNVSACAACHAKSACTMSDMQEKDIDIIDYSGNFKLGEQVNITGKESLGWIALLLAYVIPFVLVLIVLFIASLFTNELTSGLLSLAILIPYYYILYTFKEQLKKTFTFTIHKL
ncbi:SoxR reducing system RseC family protein [Ancylomarina sp. 16SWW S1-10-2]|uniref:SoxR reducing system RseC family protein n=1 Tax=Ancylomarina sp. 16SWW S1-10-2 TaxID=2499681 RepID=UPI0012AD937C|nr:SoxR reducing system RseC family protein [Ancylomarina sp. 16SWW S1-10-2]MRT93151.1 RseC/MucC family positive regulator of sigma(E) [Ancylomarina sp. 16SWW S1-10-2]